MPAKVYLYSNTNYTKRLGQTSKAFDCVITKELMREHNLRFTITNDNQFYKLIRSDSAFECEGQIFDIVDIDTESGVSNITSIAADHVSYRLSDYMIPDNYSYVGTLPEIVADILEQGVNINDEKASVIFSVGECYGGLGSVTYGLIGQENITVRAALLGLTYLGVEVDFDNFTINCPKRLGTDSGTIFDFNTNLMKFRRRWERDNDWTYDVDIADRGDIALGDDVTVHDTFIGDDVKKRIVAYERCIDNPTKNAITLGTFILDSASATVETGLAINTLATEVNNSLQQGKKYNNVAITHELGFVSTREDNMVRVIANGTDCFLVQKNVNGTWVTLASVTEDGMCAVKADGTLRVVLNTDNCFAIQKLQDGKWVNVTQADAEGIIAGRLTTFGSQYFGVIGDVQDTGGGFILYLQPRTGSPETIVKLTYESGPDQAVLKSPKSLVLSSPNIIFADENGDTISNLHSIAPRGGRILLKNGLVVGTEDGGITGQYVIDGKRYIFTSGCLTSVTEV